MTNFYFSQFNFLLESIENEVKLAIIPGSFKLPHRGHYAMIEHYSKLVGPSGTVIVLVSTPKNTIISTDAIKKVLDIYCKNLGNVAIKVADRPVNKMCYDIAMQLPEGVLIFGCSKDADTIKKLSEIKKHIEARNPNLIVLDPQTSAIDITSNNINNISLSDFKNSLDDISKIVQFIPDHLSDVEKKEVAQLLMK